MKLSGGQRQTQFPCSAGSNSLVFPVCNFFSAVVKFESLRGDLVSQQRQWISVDRPKVRSFSLRDFTSSAYPWGIRAESSVFNSVVMTFWKYCHQKTHNNVNNAVTQMHNTHTKHIMLTMSTWPNVGENLTAEGKIKRTQTTNGAP